MRLPKTELYFNLMAFASLFLFLEGVRVSNSTDLRYKKKQTSRYEVRTRGIRWWNLARTEELLSDQPVDSLTIPQLYISSPSLQTLTRKQKRLVERNPGTLGVIAQGAALAVYECQHQFQNRRWNCPTVEKDRHGGSIFGKILRTGCRETAFLHAITAAALYHSIARACSQGSISTCSCGTRFPSRVRAYEQTMTGDWRWGGCSDNAEFGHRFAESFIDSVEKGRDLRNIVNLHNVAAGRMNVMINFVPECKCHGISGSCSVKTCWLRLYSFRSVGDQLKDKFSGASMVQQVNYGYNRVTPRDIQTMIIPVNRNHKVPDPYDLVYYENSPTFCDEDSNISFRGVTGRECNASSIGVDGCDLLCCGRGHTSEYYQVRERCNCVFHWCCQVTCEECIRKKIRHLCK